MMIKNGKRNPGRGIIIVGLILITAALFLIGKNILDISRAKTASQEVAMKLLSVIKESEEKKVSGFFDGIATKEETAIPDYLLNPDKEMPTVLIEGNAYIGILSVPDLNIVLPVMKDWSYSHLKTEACRYAGSAYKKGFVICAHNYETHFGNLKYLDVGSKVLFVDIDGNEFQYLVAETETLPSTAVEEMTSNDWNLTLFTCTFGGSDRVTVRCVLQEKKIGDTILSEEI
ncbi:MAG: sortase [Lachnospiraceae bacterium]|nr:sortase [Lachnospiraceae bacterium]